MPKNIFTGNKLHIDNVPLRTGHRWIMCPNCGSTCKVELDEIWASPDHVPTYHAHMQCDCGFFAGAYNESKDEVVRIILKALVFGCENVLDPEYADASLAWKCSWCGYEDDKMTLFCPGCGHINMDYK